MIQLTKELCRELNLTYWQMTTLEETPIKIHKINREEKELLRKIILAKGVTLTEKMVKIKADGVVNVQLNQYQLIFESVAVQDSKNTIHLSKISDMIRSQEEKKLTWHKLKNIDLI